VAHGINIRKKASKTSKVKEEGSNGQSLGRKPGEKKA